MIKMRVLLSGWFAKRLLGLCIFAFVIPQAIQLLQRLFCAIVIIILCFLIFELCIVFVVKVWFPHKVNVSHVLEWTLKALLGIGHSLLNVVCHLLYSLFDLMFGRVFQGSQTFRQQEQPAGIRKNSTSNSASDQIKLLSRNGHGYTSMARIAMNNSANKPNRPARFSL